MDGSVPQTSPDLLEMTAKSRKETDTRNDCCNQSEYRAEKRAGELFAEMQRTPPREAMAIGNAAQGKADTPAAVAGVSEYRAALDSTGIPERTAQRWQELAAVPQTSPDLLEMTAKTVAETMAAMLRQALATDPEILAETLHAEKGVRSGGPIPSRFALIVSPPTETRHDARFELIRMVDEHEGAFVRIAALTCEVEPVLGH